MKSIRKDRLIVIIAVLCALILLSFIKMPVKTKLIEYETYEEKIEFKGIYFTQEQVLYTGNVKHLKIKYRDGERVAKGAQIAENIYSKEAGVIVKRLDGYENKIDLNNVKNISISEINKQFNNNHKTTGIKVINNSEWFIYGYVGQDEYFKKGMVREINIGNDYYSAEIIDTIKKKDGNYLLMRLKSDLNIINLHRTLSGYIIKSRYNGLIVPSNSIVEYSGAEGVFIKYNDYAEFRKVDVLYKNDEIAVVVPKPTAKRKLQQYDYVIIKPKGIVEGAKIK
jgi:hypothetical protein